MPENYLIICEDPYMRGKEEKKLRDKFLSSGEIELNYSVFPPEDISGIMDALGTMPFLADKRVVLVRGAENMPEEGAASMERYLDGPSPDSVLILSFSVLSPKDKTFKKFSKKMIVVSVEKFTPQKTKSAIRDFFKKEKIEISPRAVELIFELKGADPAAIKPELEKLADYSGGKKIDAEDVEEMVGRSVTEVIFKLVDAINAGNMKWALTVLGDMGEAKKEGPKIIGYLASHMRVIQKIKLLTLTGAGRNEIMSSIGKRAYYLEPQARKLSVEKINKWDSLLLKADMDIKRGLKEPSLVLEMLIADLITV
jgi:DNA polymerase III subunit delta